MACVPVQYATLDAACSIATSIVNTHACVCVCVCVPAATLACTVRAIERNESNYRRSCDARTCVAVRVLIYAHMHVA